MDKVNLRLSDPYTILIGKNLIANFPKDLKKSNLGNRYLIITDTNLEDIIGKKLLSSIRQIGLQADLISFKAGEASKNIQTLTVLLSKAQKIGIDRKSAIIALGGGVVGDIAGFVAASYMRGISYIQVPTSLLAMVDSSIGGKVAVDLPSGKNMVGAFHQPKKVYIDVSFLKTLPKKELVNGLAEIIKHSLIIDSSLFRYIQANIKKILNKDQKTLIKLIKRSCEIKASVVEQDEKEAGLRKLLNYGHTVGHALEALTNYKKYSHGEAIAIGMAVAASISNMMGMLSKKEVAIQNNLLKETGFHIKLPKIKSRLIINELKKDKKVVDGNLEFVLLEKIGKAKYGVKVPTKIITQALEENK